MSPIFRWAGGKRWLVPVLCSQIPKTCTRLVEPFCGGAALFFGASYANALLSDTNADLINAFTCLRDQPKAVLRILARWKNSEDEYYRIRSLQVDGEVERAARFLYLCRHSFNGIYRVNQQGEFNVPYCRKIWRSSFDPVELMEASRKLAHSQLLVQDFEATLDATAAGDFVFADPPYTVAHNNNGFIKYNELLFSFEDQRRLAASALRASKRGAKVFISNADHASVRELYRKWKIVVVPRFSVIGSKPGYRKQITELLIHL